MFKAESFSDGERSMSGDENLIDFCDLPQIQQNDPCIGDSISTNKSTDKIIPIHVNDCSKIPLQNVAFMNDDEKSLPFSECCLFPKKTEKLGTIDSDEVEGNDLVLPFSRHRSNHEATENRSLNVLENSGKPASNALIQSSDVFNLSQTNRNFLEAKQPVSEKNLSSADLEEQNLTPNTDLSESKLTTGTDGNGPTSCLDNLQTSPNSDCEDSGNTDSVSLFRAASENSDGRIEEHGVEASEDNASSSSDVQRIRRKRLYSFSSDSSSDANFDSSISISSSSDSSNSSGRSSYCSAAKTFKSDETLFGLTKDIWRQTESLFSRQLGCRCRHVSNVGFQNRIGGSLNLVQRLTLFSSYEKHQGCVNALNFNESGTLIASGSDDLQVVIYDWIQNKSVLKFDSGHRANVFQAKFMPFSGDCHLVSCARDGQVRLAQLSVTGACKGTKKLAQHKGTAHKLAILSDSCHDFLSCGEDGVTYQIDLRQEKPVKLCTTKENDKYVALYSIHSNPFNSYEYCVGGRDQYIRIYDTRKMENSITGNENLVKKFCPQHLMDRSIKSHVTCAVYNHNGTTILGTYNDDDIYLFDNGHSDGASHIHKYTGHRNSATVKGVNFYGPKSEYVVSGSDCGHVFLWDVESEAIVNYFHGDENGIVNVLEPHPHMPMLATSGLDNDVKLWLPLAEEPADLQGLQKVVSKNRRDRDKEMNDPEQIDSEMLWFLMHRLRRSAAQLQDDEDAYNSFEDISSSEDENDNQSVQCSQS